MLQKIESKITHLFLAIRCYKLYNILVFQFQGRTVIVKLADSHKGRTMQTQQPTGMVPMALPQAAGYPQPGKAHPSGAPIGYGYPQAPYPDSSYSSPPTGPARYPSQRQIPYATPPTLKKDPHGHPPPAPMGMGGYPYYYPKQ